MSIQDTKLDSLAVLVNKQEQIYQREDYIKFKDMFDVVKDFIVAHHLVLYGGTALNEILPQKSKFYPEEQLPDYDCFSYAAKEHAKELADDLKAKGYNYVECKSGLHEGTYKVFAEFQPVADVTQVDKDFYEYLVSRANGNTKTNQSDENLVVSPYVFLKWSLYKELCKLGSVHRWQKLVPRYEVFHKTYKLKRVPALADPPKVATGLTSSSTTRSTTDKPKNGTDATAIVKVAVSKLHEFVKSRNYPVVGAFGMALQTTKSRPSTHFINPLKIKEETGSYLDILTQNVDTTFAEISQSIGGGGSGNEDFKLVLHGATKSLAEIMPYRAHVSVKVKGIKDPFPLCRLLQVEDACTAIQSIRGYVAGAPDTILHYLYAYFMKYDQGAGEDEADAYRAAWIQKHIVSFENFIDKNIPRTAHRLTLDCYGKEKTLLDMRKAMWGKRIFVYRP